jgi:hypothetical protein
VGNGPLFIDIFFDNKDFFVLQGRKNIRPKNPYRRSTIPSAVSGGMSTNQAGLTTGFNQSSIATQYTFFSPTLVLHGVDHTPSAGIRKLDFTVDRKACINLGLLNLPKWRSAVPTVIFLIVGLSLLFGLAYLLKGDDD